MIVSRHRIRQALIGLSFVAALAPAASPALAADDTFYVYALSGCGSAVFHDYGAGAPGGGNNDDYVTVSDTCRDHHGVKAWAWLDGKPRGERYVGGGNGTTEVWDPFGDVHAGQLIGLKVCLVDGNGDPTPFGCASLSRRSDDG